MLISTQEANDLIELIDNIANCPNLKPKDDDQFMRLIGIKQELINQYLKPNSIKVYRDILPPKEKLNLGEKIVILLGNTNWGYVSIIYYKLPVSGHMVYAAHHSLMGKFLFNTYDELLLRWPFK